MIREYIPDLAVYTMQTPTGWLAHTSTSPPVFVPDPDHTWEAVHLRSVSVPAIAYVSMRAVRTPTGWLVSESGNLVYVEDPDGAWLAEEGGADVRNSDHGGSGAGDPTNAPAGSPDGAGRTDTAQI
jgi:hypothetical protein